MMCLCVSQSQYQVVPICSENILLPELVETFGNRAIRDLEKALESAPRYKDRKWYSKFHCLCDALISYQSEAWKRRVFKYYRNGERDLQWYIDNSEDDRFLHEVKVRVICTFFMLQVEYGLAKRP